MIKTQLILLKTKIKIKITKKRKRKRKIKIKSLKKILKFNKKILFLKNLKNNAISLIVNHVTLIL